MRRYHLICVCMVSMMLQSVHAHENVKQWSLNSCIEYALSENIQIKKSKIGLEGSIVDAKTARAALFPSLSFSVNQSYVNKPMVDAVSGAKNAYNANYGLNASWTIWNGGKRIKSIEQQKLNTRISEYSIAQSENEIQESITQAYLQILYAMESVKVNESVVALSLAQCERAKEMLTVGSIALSDYAQLEAQYSNDKYQLVIVQATLKDYKLQLKQLLELDGNEEMNIVCPSINDADVMMPLPSKDAVYSIALNSRPEILGTKLNVEATELDISIARAGYLPTLSMTAELGAGYATGLNLDFAQQSRNRWNESIGLSISVPIFNNRQTKSAVEKAKLAYSDSQLTLINEQKNLFKAIESMWLDANSAQECFVAAQEKLRSSQVSYNLVSEQFNLGLKNTIELLTEKNNFLSAQQEVIQAKYMAILDIQLLKFYQGETITL